VVLEPTVLVADDEYVSLAYTLTGTHRGDFQGVVPSDQRIEVRGVQIGRFSGGQIVERWGSTDELGIMQQLGIAPVPGEEPGLVGKVKAAFKA
jgi:predicted ester cyclase